MKPIENGLVVEDDDNWSALFIEALELEGLQVRSAADLAAAEETLSEMAFGIALVDMRLAQGNLANLDGMKVLDLLSRLDDDTAALVITAEGDFRVARDALRAFNAFDAIEKVQIAGDLAALSQYVRRALDAHAFSRSSRKLPLYSFLRGSKMAWDWDNDVQNIVHVRGGIQTIYRFLEELLRDVTPAIPRHFGDAATIDADFGVVRGEYWSRNLGLPVVIAFGEQERMSDFLESSDAERPGCFTLFEVDRTLADRSGAQMRGVVLALSNRERSEYMPPLEWS